MAKEIKTQVLIKAGPGRVWDILTNFAAYPGWNPFITSVEGNVAVGNTIRVRLCQPGGTPMTMRPKVLVFAKNKEFRWIGRLGFRGLFDGEHSFEIIDNGNGSVMFIQRETFRGILVPLFAKMLDHKTIKGFEQMNEALKIRAEQSF